MHNQTLPQRCQLTGELYTLVTHRCACLYNRPQKIRLPGQDKLLMEHTYTAMTPQATPSLARNPKMKPKQGKVTLPHLKGDISGVLIFTHVRK